MLVFTFTPRLTTSKAAQTFVFASARCVSL